MIFYTLEKVKIEALKYTHRKKFEKGSINFYKAAQRKGWLKEVCSHMPENSLKGGHGYNFKWDEDSIKKEALKYKTRIRFKHNSGGAYNAAIKLNILEKVCFHMGSRLNQPYTEKELLDIAKKYNTRTSFAKNDNSAYQIAASRGILEKICNHMEFPGDVSFQEKELLDIIKMDFPNAVRFRDRKVKIENKPQIKGLDIDIFVPELKKGIEFDGRYWHSFKGLARSRKHWPVEDVMDYHKIKDNWFLSKGIQILHIKEEDWLIDTKSCIDKCFKFLKS